MDGGDAGEGEEVAGEGEGAGEGEEVAEGDGGDKVGGGSGGVVRRMRPAEGEEGSEDWRASRGGGCRRGGRRG